MPNFGDLKTRIADELDRTDLGSQIDRELRAAVRHYEVKRWWFNEHTTSTTATSSTTNFAMPSDLIQLDRLELIVTARPRELNQISWQRFVDNWRFNTTAGEPQEFARFANRVWLGPIPRQDYELTWYYMRTLSPTSFSDGTNNEWTAEAGDLISVRTLKALGARTLHFASGELALYAQLERDAYNSLCELSEQRVKTGLADPWQ